MAVVGGDLARLDLGRGEPALLPGGSAERIVASITGRLLTYPDETVILPGHGPATSVGTERRFNPWVGSRG